MVVLPYLQVFQGLAQTHRRGIGFTKPFLLLLSLKNSKSQTVRVCVCACKCVHVQSHVCPVPAQSPVDVQSICL